jgi:glycine/D-amino acid oxidase-like deaminating enzyme
MSITIKKKRKTPKTGPEKYEAFRLQGYADARAGVFHPEAYAKGMARRAYTHGKQQWVEHKEEK